MAGIWHQVTQYATSRPALTTAVRKSRHTEFRTAGPNIFSITNTVFSLHIQKCVSFHIHRAESIRGYQHLQITPELWVFSMGQLAALQPSGNRKVQVEPFFLTFVHT